MTQAVTLARPYARAAFNLAHQHKLLNDWSNALGNSGLIAADPRIAALLKHPSLSLAEAIALVAPQQANQLFEQFLLVLAQNRRLGLLPEICNQFETLRAESEQVIKAKITSAAKLSEAEVSSLKAALKKRFSREVEISTTVDPDLIGGAVIDTGDIVIDGSIKTKLARLAATLSN